MKCYVCGGDMIMVTVGEYECIECGASETNDYDEDYISDTDTSEKG